MTTGVEDGDGRIKGVELEGGLLAGWVLPEEAVSGGGTALEEALGVDEIVL